jgi:chromate reductase
MSGVLKNALDWLSRPHGKSVLKAKPILTFTASPAFTGGVRAQQQLNETLWAVSAELTRYPQIVIGSVHGKLSNGRLMDESVRNYIKLGLEALREMILL